MMRRLLFLALVLLTLLAVGCSQAGRELPEKSQPPAIEDEPGQKDRNLRETVFYLPDADKKYLVPVRMHIPWEEGIAKATLRYCTEGNLPAEAVRAGFHALLPAGTTVLGLSVKDGLARVDFSREFLSFAGEAEDLWINGIVYTLTEFPTIERVQFFVEGQELKFAGKSLSQPLGREFGLNLEIDSGMEDFNGTQGITLYYLLATDDHVFYVPVTRIIKEPDNWLEAIGRELLEGPKRGSILFSAIPKGLTLKNISQEGSSISLHLDGELVSEGGQVAADRLRQQLALTFTEIKGILNITVLLGGKAPDFGPGISFPVSFGRPRQWNVAD